MADVKYARDTNLFDCQGLDLNRPADSVKPKKFPYLKNARSYQEGRVEPRFGLTDIALVVAGQSPVHSVRRLNDPASASYIRVVGTGTHVAYGTTSFTDLDSGYSGDPLALIPWKPEASPSPFMYVADRSRMRKVGTAGSLHTIGLAAPTSAPAVALTNAPVSKVVDSFQATAGWGQGGTAGAPSLLSAGPGLRVNTTIATIVYDAGTTGWASVNPTSAANIGVLSRLSINAGAEIVVVQAVYPGAAATTIAAIIYDTGTSGLASLVLTTPVDLSAADAIIQNSTAGESARILSVTIGPGGTSSIRVSTSNTWAATNAVQILPTYRAYYTINHAAAETITEDGVRSAITSGTGTLTKTSALDLSMLASGVAVQPDDLMHIAIRVSDPTVITELKVLLDVDIATNDFAHNYYWRSFRASDLTPAARNLQPIISNASTIIQRVILDGSGRPIHPTTPLDQSDPQNAFSTQALPGANDLFNANLFQGADRREASGGGRQLLRDDITTPASSPIVISQQMAVGDSQWCELVFRISDLIRVGTDDSRTLANVATLRVTALVTGNVNLDLDSWIISGGYGPDTGSTTASPYFYRYRARNPATNVASNFSPATRYPANPFRQSVTVTGTQYAAPSGTSLTTSDFVLDVERFGGEIADWHYAGTIPNSASPVFTDIYPDDIIGGNPILMNDQYQPWPILGTPVSGTTATVAGTTVNDALTNFNMSWAPGTRILINSQSFTLYRVISTSRLELAENAGSQSAVTWRIDEPTILAQPLPCLWQWNNTFFACGDLTNPGRLYYSNPDSETTTPSNWIDITSPSEPLMNGLQYNVRSYVFSSENQIQVLPTGTPESPYRAEFIPNGKGLFSRWALTLTPAPFNDFLSKDGIYRTVGGAPLDIAEDDLSPLFPNEGNLGFGINGVLAPSIIAAQAANLRIAYYDHFTYFDYAAQPEGTATLALLSDPSNAPVGWFYDTYTPRVVFRYGEEGSGVHSLLCGGSDGHLYQYAGSSDNGTAFSMEFTTPSRDQNAPRENKLYGDIMLDADTQSLAVSCTPQFNNNATSAIPVLVTTASRLQTAIPFDSAWQTARNVSLNVVVSISTAARPKFYIWEPRWTFESAPISALAWEISPSTFGMDNFKHVGLCKITHVSTVDISFIFTIDNVVQPTITIPNSGGVYEQTVFRVPVMKAKLYKLRIASDTEWRIDPRDSFIEVKDWGSDGEYQKLRVFGDYSLIEG